MKKTASLLALLLLATLPIACVGRTPIKPYDGSIAVEDQPVEPDETADYEPEELADTIDVPSKRMGRNIKAIIVLPGDYRDPERADMRYPVVYLLHGYDGSYRDWYNHAELHNIAFANDIIIVCPDGQDSWYFDSPIDPKMQFETFVSSELVAYVDAHYRTTPDRQHRGISGLSMGGHGALFLAMRHPDVFAACASMSGGVDITKFPKSWKIAQRLGPYDANPQRWVEHSVAGQVKNLKPGQLDILIDDGYDDIFFTVNQDLHKALLDKGIQHEYTVRPGRHSWDYWVNALDNHIMFFCHHFEALSDNNDRK